LKKKLLQSGVKTRYFCLLIAIFAILICNAQTRTIQYNAIPKYEVRAVWLTTIGGLDWPHNYAQSNTSIARQQKELIDILDKLKAAGLNTVLLQTRIRATTIYPSRFEPWDGCLSGVPGRTPGYDALKFAIDECHKRGMEIHAWVVTIPIGKWNSYGCQKLRARYPRMVKRIGDEGYLNPETSQTADYLADICEEITKNYDIDGIHLDYIRYPETWKRRVSLQEGRSNITSIVREISKRVKRAKPWVKMSCSPIGKYDDLSRYWSHGWNANTKGCQDAQGWLRMGLMDELFPMMYFRGDQFFPFAIDWAEHSYGRIVAPGYGIWFLDRREGNWPLETITREMQVVRQYGMGHTFFRSKFFTDNVKGIYDFTQKQFNLYPSLIPAMTWQNAVPPTPPTQMDIKKSADATVLSWHGARNTSDAPYILYNVYSNKTYPVDISDARNLVVTRTTKNQIVLPKNAEQRYFAITALDRYGNESSALQSHSEGNAKSSSQVDLLQCDGNRLILPQKPSTLDAKIIAIETIQGSIIASRQYATTINVANIPEGFYAIRTINKKGISHRIGFFKLERKK